MSLSVETLCPTCGSELQAVQVLDGRSFAQDEDMQYDCVVCGYRYSYIDATGQEVEKFDGKPAFSKPLFCGVCNKEFNQSSTLKRHLIVHSGERPFVCGACDKSFKTKAALKRHTIIHTGECPFECSTCKRKFNQISNLRKHLVIHNNNCPFYCNICGKGFNQLSNLKKHLVVHREHKADSESAKPEHSVIPIGLEKTVTRPVVTFIKPAES